MSQFSDGNAEDHRKVPRLSRVQTCTGVFSTLERAKQFIQDRWNRLLLQSSDYVMYGSDIMGITELELDNPDYEEDIEFNYGL